MTCVLSLRIDDAQPKAALAANVPVELVFDGTFTVCGRGKEGGGKERVEGKVILMPKGSYGDADTLRIRATVREFNRESYQIGPKWTSGWLARVQSLAQVVAPTGQIDVNLFARLVP